MFQTSHVTLKFENGNHAQAELKHAQIVSLEHPIEHLKRGTALRSIRVRRAMGCLALTRLPLRRTGLLAPKLPFYRIL